MDLNPNLNICVSNLIFKCAIPCAWCVRAAVGMTVHTYNTLSF